ncbi:MAG: ATP-dependent DNA helicase [Geminicoccaceae bacterium]
MTLSPDQGRAIDVLSDQDNWIHGNYGTLTGLAGTGKTFLARHLAQNFYDPVILAPTNKAAKVLTENGLPATSIHKAIYHPPGEKTSPAELELLAQIEDEEDEKKKKELEKRLQDLRESLGEPGLIWRINPEGDAARADIIFVDEASMVDQQLGADLASFGVPIIALGDPAQLPPVNGECYFDLDSPDYHLTEIHRQARDNPIIRLAHDVRNEKPLRIGTMGSAVRIVERGFSGVSIPEDPALMPKVICGKHITRWQISKKVRNRLGFKDWLPEPGEPLWVRKNSDTHEELINGAEGTAIKFEDMAPRHACRGTVNIEGIRRRCVFWSGPFEEHKTGEKINLNRGSPHYYPAKDHERIDFGYVITGHSAQGSQWPDVLVYDEGNVFWEDRWRWRYVAATRAQERLTIII